MAFDDRRGDVRDPRAHRPGVPQPLRRGEGRDVGRASPSSPRRPTSPTRSRRPAATASSSAPLADRQRSRRRGAFCQIDGVKHQVVPVNDIRLHVVEEGEGPLVLLVHGFPESWYSWRHQLPVLAAAGYRAVALDVRGYGRSSAPAAVDAYRMLRHVADNVALVAALGAETAVVVGHDWGAPIAWNSALLRPDVFTAVAGLSVPFSPAGDTRPTDAFRRMAGDEEFYIEYFQQPGSRRGRARAGRAALAARLLLHRLGRRPAADRRDRGDDPARGADARSLRLPRRDAGVAHRRRPRRLRR